MFCKSNKLNFVAIKQIIELAEPLTVYNILKMTLEASYKIVHKFNP